MEVNGLVTIPSPWDRINILSKLTFSWVWSLFIRAHKKDLEFSDLYRCPESDETHRIRHTLEINWDKQLNIKGKPSLFWALFASFGPELIVLYIPDAIKAAVGIVMAAIGNMLILQLNLVSCSRVGARIRAACCALIYRKVCPHTSVCFCGACVILIVVALAVGVFDGNGNTCAVYTISSTNGSYVSEYTSKDGRINRQSNPFNARDYRSGMGILVLFIPFQVLMGRMFRSIRQKTAELTDSRIRLMQEIIAGMRIIKMYAWEQPFALLVANTRK
ncbi:unnamed protein product [Medioppia subpectinata]|uniref:ABC transmembrane type-1 domain-containing protein n=1 Tax=Medioppia subpectinata TaxID=1979941 RepID=A0A7R9PTX9_9ACAR|nr:unnamed protein product [Medioppia subpectinata]CAG2100192.1 unnamed protein product [Medioppia subpectinata]